MPCERLPMGDGAVAIVCTRGRRVRQRCDEPGCHRPMVALCDWPVAGGTCSRRVCVGHQRHQVRNVDYCPTHARVGAMQLELASRWTGGIAP